MHRSMRVLTARKFLIEAQGLIVPRIFVVSIAIAVSDTDIRPK
jgi:hypothetical protein